MTLVPPVPNEYLNGLAGMRKTLSGFLLVVSLIRKKSVSFSVKYLSSGKVGGIQHTREKVFLEQRQKRDKRQLSLSFSFLLASDLLWRLLNTLTEQWPFLFKSTFTHKGPVHRDGPKRHGSRLVVVGGGRAAVSEQSGSHCHTQTLAHSCMHTPPTQEAGYNPTHRQTGTLRQTIRQTHKLWLKTEKGFHCGNFISESFQGSSQPPSQSSAKTTFPNCSERLFQTVGAFAGFS